MSDLLPCPFCGADFKMSQEPLDSPYVGGKFYLYHDYGPLGSAARKCPISVSPHFNTEAEAVAAWNRRAIPATDAREAALREAQGRVKNAWPPGERLTLGEVLALISSNSRTT